MLIKDSEVLTREQVLTPQEKHRAELMGWLEEEAKRFVVVEDSDTVNPTNLGQQLGRPMTSAELELRLGKLLPPSIRFVHNPWIHDKRAVVRVKPEGGFDTICPYESGFMPEHEVLKANVEWVRDRHQTHLDRKDLPKYEIVPGAGVVWDSGAVRPGWKKVVRLGHTLKRGWRTVLIRLVQAGLLTPTQVEREFGVDDRVQWANAMGKRSIIAEY